ncbi:MAG: hypothetical protein EOO88_41020 [Pedobacter sp.]|nr:MAG: hypothetical protein EOO88_41020 [Pedobacter sp.]
MDEQTFLSKLEGSFTVEKKDAEVKPSAAHEFGLYICSELSGRFLNRLIAVPQLVTNTNPLNVEFTNRDVELLRLISEGFTNQEIAEKMFSSVRTIEKQRLHLINKTDSRNTVVLICFAKQHGII